MPDSDTPLSSSRELARIAGVSHMTVSRAFRGDPRIREETRQRILDLAKKHGYRPNPVISLAMRAKRRSNQDAVSGALAFLHSNHTEDAWHSVSHLRPYLEGVRSRALEMGFALDEFWTGQGGLTLSRFESIVQNRGIQGVVVAPPPGFVRHLRLHWDQFSCATFNHDSWRPLLHRVATDDLHSMSVALREIERLGYNRPGLAVTYNTDASRNFALSGRLLAAQQKIPSAQRVPPLIYTGPDITDVRSDFLKWLDKKKPDCVICADVATLDLIEESGRRVPADIGLVHLGIGPDVDDWSGVVSDRHAIGAAAVDLVINRMVRNETGIPAEPREVLLRGKWQKGRTTRTKP